MWDITIHPLRGLAVSTSLQRVLCYPPNQYVGHHNPPPVRGPASLLALIPVLHSTNMWDITIHLLFGAQRPRWHSFLSPTDVGPSPNHPLWGSTSLLAHHLVSTPLRETTRRLAHRPMSSSDTICNDPSPPLTDIVLFKLSLTGFPSMF